MAVLIKPHTRGCGRRYLEGRRRFTFLLLASLGLMLGLPDSASAQDVNPNEYQIKAVFLFNFVQFVDWPASSFPTADTPIRIGVLGDDPFERTLEAAVQGETVRQRPIVVHRSSRLQDLLNCHVLFVCRSERAQMGAIINALGGRPILSVGDMPDFARRGGIVNFYLEGQKVRFEINRAAAQQGGLRLSSQLLSLARLVGPPQSAER